MKNSKSELILNVAQKLFAQYGFKKTTLDEIARSAHITKSSIYYYFDSKEDIFRAVLEKENRLWSQKIREVISKANTPQEKLRAYVVTKMKHLSQLVNFYSALKEEYLEHYSFIERIRKKNLQEEIKIVRAILKEGAKKGIFQVEDLELVAFVIVTALKGLEYPWAMKVPMPDMEEHIDLLLKVLFNGLLKR
ncbi:TetR/AcrR family transcriptional regulator [Candidatus Aerophobetes bacterium]|uniref:TetR/AcrR family transcriptional regulator n=1 Tax=Aerophobetes bacterium TaxID=2030807 RepID=A0A662DCG0_UNCAE|nr:MAG: TetR/AcrR family transcriptional regulator [Candidatus Aerophobetes bacterium]